MESDRGHWYIITALVLGVGLGILISWVLYPNNLEETHPRDLRSDYKDVYRSLIARAYQVNQNLPRAEARLALLGDENPPQALAAQAQRSLAEEGNHELAKILANLSAALQQTPQPPRTSTPTSPLGTQTPGTGTPADKTPVGASPTVGTGTPRGTESNTTDTPLPTLTATATEAPPFIIEDHAPLCDPSLDTPLIQVYATNAAGEGIPGVEIIISWPPDHRETFLTGLKPEIGMGYADFEGELGVEYTLELPESGLLLSDLTLQTCQTDSGETYPGSYQIYITHPN